MIFRTVELLRANFFSHVNGVKHQERRVRQRQLLEVLEARQLLSSTVAPHDGFFNVTGLLASTTVPANVAAGQAINGSVTVSIVNAGTLAFPTGHPNQQVTVKILAHGISGDVVLTTSKPFDVSSIKPTNLQNFTIPLKNVPALPAGDYTYSAVITPLQALAESSTVDNLVTTTAANTTLPLHVVAIDVTGTLGDPSIPSAIVAGSSTQISGSVPVILKNSSNVALPSGEQVTVVIKAHNTATNADVILNTTPAKTYSVSAIGSGKTTTVAPSVHLSGKTLPAGTYILEALVTPVQKSSQGGVSNNLITLNAADQTVSLVSGAATVDLTGTLGPSTVVGTSASTTGQLTITVSNTGDLPVTTSQPISFSIVARPAGELDALSDVALTTTAQNFSIHNLKSGQSANFTVTVNSTTALSGGLYNLLATIVAPGVTEPTLNNVASQTKSGAPVRVSSMNPVGSILLGNPVAVLPGSITVNPNPVISVNPVVSSPIPVGTIISPVAPVGVGTIVATNPSGIDTTSGGVLTIGGSMSSAPTISSPGTIDSGELHLTPPNSGTLIINSGAGAISIVGTNPIHSVGTLTLQPPASTLTLPGPATLTASGTGILTPAVVKSDNSAVSTAGAGTLILNVPSNGAAGNVIVNSTNPLVASESISSNSAGSVNLTDLSTVLNNFGSVTMAWTSDGTTIDLANLADVLNHIVTATTISSSSSPQAQ